MNFAKPHIFCITFCLVIEAPPSHITSTHHPALQLLLFVLIHSPVKKWSACMTPGIIYLQVDIKITIRAFMIFRNGHKRRESPGRIYPIPNIYLWPKLNRSVLRMTRNGYTKIYQKSQRNPLVNRVQTYMHGFLFLNTFAPLLNT